MNTICITHGEAEWNKSKPDLERELTKRGIKQAITAAKMCKNFFPFLSKESKIGIYSSPAKRCKDTAKLFSKNFFEKKELPDFVIIDDLEFEKFEKNYNKLLRIIKKSSSPLILICAHGNISKGIPDSRINDKNFPVAPAISIFKYDKQANCDEVEIMKCFGQEKNKDNWIDIIVNE